MSTANLYGSVLMQIVTGTIDMETDTLKISLHTSSYAPDQDADDFYDDVTDEISGTGYTAGGETLTGVALTYDGPTNTLTVDCDDPVWTAATLSGIRYAVVYKDTGTASTSPLICWMDFLTNQSVSGSNFSIVIPGTGLIQATVA